MSWFADIAGKAENFLNQIDQNAAEALHTPSKDPARPRKTEPFLETTNETNHSHFRSSNNDEPHVASTSSQASESKVMNGTTTTFPSGNRSDSLQQNKSKKQQSSSHNSKGGLSSKRNTSASSVTSSSSNSSLNNASKSSVGGDNARKPPIGKGKTNSKSSTINATAYSSSSVDSKNEDELIAYLNSSEPSELNESLILKGEVESQARELKLITTNHRTLQKDYEELRRKLTLCQEKLTTLESSRQSNEAEEHDLRKLLEEKNKELSSISSRHEQALEALQKLELSQENLQKLEQCLLENSQLKLENRDLLKRTDMISQQVETADNHVLSMKSTLSSMEKEFSNYKDKAKSILSYKDELIASLKSEGSSVPQIDTSANTTEELFAEVTALKNERELLHADLSQTRAVVESLKDDNIRLEKEISTLRYYSEDLTSHLKKERETVGNLQNENLQVCQQLTSLQFDLEREKNDKRKNEELVTQYKKDLHKQYESSSQNGNLSNGNSASDKEIQKLKTRLNALSQSLLEKQSLINDISTDKQLLQIEVERLKNDLRDCRVESNSNEYCHVSGLPQTVIASQPLYLSESPWDSRVSARMKKMYSQMDAVFCQFGLALRRRPNLRLGMSLYVIFLHLWVFFVLFSWMHNAVPDPE